MATGDEGSPDDRPNVVLITAHDLGQHLGCYGIETVDTPNIDALADRGVQFEQAYATSPVCSPARGSLLTGRYPQANGLMGLIHSPWWWRLDEDEEPLPELLGSMGYETHLAGIQHVAPDEARLGFDHRHAPAGEAADTVDAAPRVFEAADDGPIYAQFGFSEVHRAFEQGTETEAGVYVPPYIEATEEMREDFGRFQAAIGCLDDRVGDIVTALERSGHREETVIVFAADHGIPYPGAKWWCRASGLEIALIVDGPGPTFSSAAIDDTVISNIDVVPTLLDVLGQPTPEDIHGVSFRDYLDGNADEPPRTAAFAQYLGDDSRAVVTPRRTLIRNFGPGREVDYPVETAPTNRAPSLGPANEPLPYAQLYDRATDPHELADVADAHPAIVADLSERIHSWMVDVDDPLLEGPVPTPYYERAMDDFTEPEQCEE